MDELRSTPPEAISHDYIAVASPRRKIFIIVAVAALFFVVMVVLWWRQRVPRSDPGSLPAERIESRSALTNTVATDDKDADGLSDAQEAELKTSEREFDTDGDGLADAEELKVWQTDPTEVDTDGDGFADGYEVLNGYNPKGAGKLE